MIIAQISDPHITDTHGDSERENGPAVHLQRAVAHLTDLPALPDVVLVTGDCVNSGSPSEYAHFRTLLKPLTMPVYIIPGNHDNRELLQRLSGAQGTQPMPAPFRYTSLHYWLIYPLWQPL